MFKLYILVPAAALLAMIHLDLNKCKNDASYSNGQLMTHKVTGETAVLVKQFCDKNGLMFSVDKGDGYFNAWSKWSIK